MSRRANRTLWAVREFIFAPSLCSTRISAIHLPFLTSPTDSNAFGRSRKCYHSDIVVHFRNIRPHGGKLPNLVPHALKTTAHVSQERTHPVGSASNHNNAADSSLLLPFQLGIQDVDVTSGATNEQGKFVPDVMFTRLESSQRQRSSFIAPDKASHKETIPLDVHLDNTEPSRMLCSSVDNGQGSQRTGQEERFSLVSWDIGSGNPVDSQEPSVAKSLVLEINELSAGQKTVTSARQIVRKRNIPAILKVRRDLLNSARAGDIRSAFRLYLEFTRLATPDVEVADILIRALCRGTLQAPPRHQIIQALQVYNNLVEAGQQNAEEDIGFFDSRGPSSIAEQRCHMRIYNTLLRALSAPLSVKSSPEVQAEYTKVSMEILAAMKARGFVPDGRTVCSILLLRFRSAANHEEAYEFYASLVADLEAAHARGSMVLDSDSDLDSSESPRRTSGTSPLLDSRGYKRVLNAFGKLSFPWAPVAPAPLWFAIVKDIRKRGHAVTVEDYTIYLGSILAQTTSPFTLQRTAVGFASSQDEEARIEAMMACVRHLHKQLVLDMTMVPDATLMNALMNAYQHLGAFDDALKVFNATWLSGRVDNVTPITMFDACGHARKSREATMIWCKLVEKGWQFDKHTLDTWVECLCRVGNVEAACKFVCIYMGRDKCGYSSKRDTQPDVQTCLILLKLSWVVGQNLDVKEKIRTHLPHIWKELASHYT